MRRRALGLIASLFDVDCHVRGFCDEIIHIYLATKLEFDAPNPDDDEFVNVDLVPLHELIDAVLDGKIEDAKTVVGALACDSIAHRLGGTEL